MRHGAGSSNVRENVKPMSVRSLVYVAALAAPFALFILGPSAAQVPPQRLPPSAGGAPDLNTVTVMGRSTVRIPADRARFSLSIYGRGASTTLDEAGKTIAAILRDHGVSDATWTLPSSGSVTTQNASGSIVGSLAKPTREKAEALIRDTFHSLPPSVIAFTQGAQLSTTLIVDDCSAAEARAQEAVIADARTRATLVARAARVGVGKVVAVYEQLPQTSGCATKPDTVPEGLNFYGALRQPGLDNFDVIVSITATVSFAIR